MSHIGLFAADPSVLKGKDLQAYPHVLHAPSNSSKCGRPPKPRNARLRAGAIPAGREIP
jgi:hypothetical protein